MIMIATILKAEATPIINIQKAKHDEYKHKIKQAKTK
jgi:hypothetical protein